MNLTGAMAMLAGFRTKARLLFQIATVLALVYVLREFWRQWPVIADWRPGWFDFGILSGAAILYGLSLFLLAEMWQRLLQVFGHGAISRRQAYSVYAQTQIAKYVPGNLFHYVGRHMMLAPLTITHRALLKVSFIEIGAMISGALAVALFASIFMVEIAAIPLPPLRIAITLLLVGSTIAIFSALPGHPKQRLLPTLAILAPTISFFALQSLIFITIGVLLGWNGSFVPSFAAAVSWIVGFVIPGAPGGLGAREFSLLVLLKGHYTEASILIAAALFRVVTVAGDVICFAIGHVLGRRSREVDRAS